MPGRNLVPWVHLNLISSIGPRRCQLWLEEEPDPEAILAFSEKDLLARGMAPERTRRILTERAEAEPSQEIEAATRRNVELITRKSDRYPSKLLDLPDPPLVLYVKSSRWNPEPSGLAIVGARVCSPYGQSQARRFAVRLAACAVPIVSGLALGIDSAAHRGALDAGGVTIAVLGSGIDQIYPREHGPLTERISECGVLLSEFPLGTHPARLNFPRRNRIISGLSDGVLVIEAAEKSGSLITADFALDQGKEVYCLPGSVHSKLSRGTHRLIRQGATLVTSPEEILEAHPRWASPALPQDKKTRETAPGFDPVERRVIEALRTGPLNASELIAQTNLLPQEAMGALTRLELKGWARKSINGGFGLILEG